MPGVTPLHGLAASAEKPIIHRMECARIMLEAGADPTIMDSFGSVPSDYVDDTDIPEPELLDEFPHLRNKTMKSIFFDAIPNLKIFNLIEDGNVDAVKKALMEEEKEGLQVAKDSDGNGLLVFTLQQILKHLDIDDDESQPTSALFFMLQIFKDLMEDAELDPNVPDKSGGTPLFTLCHIMKSMYTKGRANSKMKYLEQAALTLFQHKATISSNTIEILHDASRRGNTDMIRFMVETLQVDPNTKGRQGFTALHFAARSGRLEVLEYLIGCGAEVNGDDDRGKSAMDYAVANNRGEIIKVLKAHIG